MGKYEPLTDYLDAFSGDSWDARFSDIEKVLGFDLPRSAYAYPAWWANQDSGHSQTSGWRNAGWETCKVDLPAKRVRFTKARRRRRPPSATPDRSASPSLNSLIERASKITEITDRDELLRKAVTELMQREAARRLIALGGTMPDAKAPPRGRFD